MHSVTPAPSLPFEWLNSPVASFSAARHWLMAWRQCRADSACRAALRRSLRELDARSLRDIGAPDELLARAMAWRTHSLDGGNLTGAREATRDWRRW